MGSLHFGVVIFLGIAIFWRLLLLRDRYLLKIFNFRGSLLSSDPYFLGFVTFWELLLSGIITRGSYFLWRTTFWGLILSVNHFFLNVVFQELIFSEDRYFSGDCYFLSTVTFWR